MLVKLTIITEVRISTTKCLFDEEKKEIAKIFRLFFPGHSTSIFSTEEKKCKVISKKVSVIRISSDYFIFPISRLLIATVEAT